MNETPAAPSRKVIIRLSAMFWLAQMADAAALVLLGGHMSALGFSGMQISSAYATMGVAALVSPFVAGWLADRFFPSQTMLGGCYLLLVPLLAPESKDCGSNCQKTGLLLGSQKSKYPRKVR